jgi:hypothetical protein
MAAATIDLMIAWRENIGFPRLEKKLFRSNAGTIGKPTHHVNWRAISNSA